MNKGMKYTPKEPDEIDRIIAAELERGRRNERNHRDRQIRGAVFAGVLVIAGLGIGKAWTSQREASFQQGIETEYQNNQEQEASIANVVSVKEESPEEKLTREISQLESKQELTTYSKKLMLPLVQMAAGKNITVNDYAFSIKACSYLRPLENGNYIYSGANTMLVEQYAKEKSLEDTISNPNDIVQFFYAVKQGDELIIPRNDQGIYRKSAKLGEPMYHDGKGIKTAYALYDQDDIAKMEKGEENEYLKASYDVVVAYDRLSDDMKNKDSQAEYVAKAMQMEDTIEQMKQQEISSTMFVKEEEEAR